MTPIAHKVKIFLIILESEVKANFIRLEHSKINEEEQEDLESKYFDQNNTEDDLEFRAHQQVDVNDSFE